MEKNLRHCRVCWNEGYFYTSPSLPLCVHLISMEGSPLPRMETGSHSRGPGGAVVQPWRRGSPPCPQKPVIFPSNLGANIKKNSCGSHILYREKYMAYPFLGVTVWVPSTRRACGRSSTSASWHSQAGEGLAGQGARPLARKPRPQAAALPPSRYLSSFS